jgi:hypothetical protein
VEEGWRSKAAKDAELLLSDAEDSEEEFYQVLHRLARPHTDRKMMNRRSDSRAEHQS